MDVKSIIKRQGYTIEKVASEMGISRVTLSQNICRNPTVGTLKRISDVIGCKVGDFFIDELDNTGNESGFTCPHCGKEIEIDVKKKNG